MASFQSIDIEPGIPRQIKRLVDRWYSLGNVVRIEQSFAGYVNKSFAVWIDKNGCRTKYFLRRYNPGIAETEIRFEHALIRHLRDNGFTQVADVISGLDGITFVGSDDTDAGGYYWALFEFLEGEDKYSWIRTNLTDAEFKNSAEMLARMHHAGCNFIKPPGADRAQPRIMDYLSTFADTYRKYAQQAGQRKCDRLVLKHFKHILVTVSACLALKDTMQGFLEIPVHCDYHPGNIKYREFEAVGLFDFDWSKVDYRIFDVALALVYFVSVWTGETAGSLRLDKFKLFLKAYQQTCRKLGRIEPLSGSEQEMMLPMVAAANLYVLNWDLMDFYSLEDPNDAEYFTYIDHNLKLMYWIDDNRDAIKQAILQACGYAKPGARHQTV
ncbi:MAG: phosphotransferase [Desulfobacterales bacterium]|jgi:homoserine kinase type II